MNAERSAAEDAVATTSDRRTRLLRAAPLAAVALELLVAGAYLLGEHRHLWFFGDDWDFFLNRDLGHDPAHALFSAHGGHWVTLPVIVFRILFASFGVAHYLPYAVVVVAAHLSVCIVLWVLLRRVAVDQWIAVALVGVMAFLGAGAENTLWDFQIGFIGSVFFGLLALVLIDRDGPFCRRDAWSWLASVAGLMCSGIGVPMVATLAVYTALRRGWRVALTVISLPTTVYVAWLLAFGRDQLAADNNATGRSEYLQVPTYFWHGLTNAWEQISGIPGSGALILAALVIPLLRSGLRDKLSQLAVAGLTGTAIFYLFTAITRVQVGVEQATSSRYIYIAAALSMPAVAWAIAQLPRRSVVHSIAFALLIALVVVNGVSESDQFAAARRSLLVPNRIIASVQIARRGDRVLADRPDPTFSPDITVEQLARPEIADKFPSTDPTPQGMIDADNFLKVLATPVSLQLGPPNMLRWSGITGEADPTGCASGIITSNFAFVDMVAPPAGAMVRLTTTGTSIATQLLDGGLVSAAHLYNNSEATPLYVGAITDPSQTVRIVLPPSGSVTLCSGSSSS
jgi:hypothetical protein